MDESEQLYPEQSTTAIIAYRRQNTSVPNSIGRRVFIQQKRWFSGINTLLLVACFLLKEIAPFQGARLPLH